jgi:hypothetical protein
MLSPKIEPVDKAVYKTPDDHCQKSFSNRPNLLISQEVKKWFAAST